MQRRNVRNNRRVPRRRINRRNPRNLRLSPYDQAASNLGQVSGQALNAMFAGYPKQAYNAISRIMGSGDYKIQKNVLLNSNQVPQFMNLKSNSMNSVFVSHREYLFDFNSSTSFNSVRLPINPGIYYSFPWLSTLAANFEEYRFHGLIFQFHSTSASALNSTNTALGTIIMATQYDVLDDAFINKTGMENYQFATSCKPAEDMIHPVECAVRSNPLGQLYVRVGDVPSNSDQRMYDLGYFTLAAVGSQASANVGELWVSYVVELIKPKLVGGIYGGAVISCHYRIPVTGITTGTAYFGSSLPDPSDYESGSNLEITFSNTTLTFPEEVITGVFLIQLFYVGANTVLTNAISMATTTNCTGVNIYKGGGSVNQQPAAGDTSTTQFISKCIRITGSGAVLTMSSGTLPGTLTSCDLVITQLNSDISS